jgi:hypothetical protein
VYGGTSDLVDDLDCVYIIDEIEADEPGSKVVEFRNIKQRGNVAQSLAFSYASQSDISYIERLQSVQLVDPADLASAREAAERRSDSEIIATVESCIGDGINVKMDLIREVAGRLTIPRRAAQTVIERYTGTTPGIHRWRFKVEARGAKVFALLQQPQVIDESEY